MYVLNVAVNNENRSPKCLKHILAHSAERELPLYSMQQSENKCIAQTFYSYNLPKCQRMVDLRPMLFVLPGFFIST